MTRIFFHHPFLFIALHRGVTVWKPQMPTQMSCLSILIPIWPLTRIEISFPKWTGARPTCIKKES
jgi:hypothetical protein